MSIRSTIEAELVRNGYSQYGSYAEPVITALEQREQRIIAALTETAGRNGIRNAREHIVAAFEGDRPAFNMAQGFHESRSAEPVSENRSTQSNGHSGDVTVDRQQVDALVSSLAQVANILGETVRGVRGILTR